MTNPLKQYFRRPALYIKLPYGKYSSSVVDNTPTNDLPVYPMTAIDDITAKTPDALMNGHAIADIIKSCVPNVLDPWKINALDLDAILVAIKMATSGGSMELTVNCPKCNEQSSFDLNLSLVLNGFNSDAYVVPLVVDGLKLYIEPLKYTDMNAANDGQFQIQRELKVITEITDMDKRIELSKELQIKVAHMTMSFVAQSIAKIEMPDGNIVTDREFISEYVQNIDKPVYEKIRDHAVNIREASKIQPLDVTCMHCEHEFKQPLTLNISDFFD